MIYQTGIKPFFDFVFAMICLILASPIVLILIAILSIESKGKPFFIQPRPGKDERIFKLIKFRTMNEKRDERGCLLPDSKRLTVVGKFVRKTSLDELPQLLNIIKGDMSFVGPRPLLVQYLPLYSKKQRSRHQVKPGITGWAQVNGRNNLTWSRKFELDEFYVKNISFLLDFKILVMTIISVLRAKNIALEEAFNGKN